jgi:hypothetical protein
VSHGKKKWIVAFDGKVKRSNDRTKKDYYRGLKYWSAYGQGWRRAQPEFCPQCKHNYKPIKAHNDAYWGAWKELRAEWDAGYEKRLSEYNVAIRRWWKWGVGNEPAPVHPDNDYKSFHKYTEENRYRIPAQPIRDEEAWLCPKHRRYHDAEREMWRYPYPGCKENYKWTRKQQYRDYRNDIRILMQKAKYDEEYYEDIFPYVHGWLD